MPGDGDDRAADDRPDGPRHVLDGLEERVAALELVLLEEVRHRGVDGRAVDRVPEPGDPGERDDPTGAVDERQRDEDARAEEVGGDHQLPPREPVEQRADHDADEDRRQEHGDQERADPRSRVRAVVDVTVSAIVASHVPSSEPSVATNRSRKLAVPAEELGGGPRLRPTSCRGGGRPPSPERRGEKRVLVGGSDGHADRSLRTNAFSGRTITPSRRSASKRRLASVPVSA